MKRFMKNIIKELDEVINYNIQWVLDRGKLENYVYFVDRAYEYVLGYCTCLIKYKVNVKFKDQITRKSIMCELTTYIHEKVRLFDYESKLGLKGDYDV